MMCTMCTTGSISRISSPWILVSTLVASHPKIPRSEQPTYVQMEKNAARERMFPHPAMARPDKIRIGNTWSQSTRQPQELSLIDVLPSVIPSTPTPQHISADPGQCKGERVREKIWCKQRKQCKQCKQCEQQQQQQWRAQRQCQCQRLNMGQRRPNIGQHNPTYIGPT